MGFGPPRTALSGNWQGLLQFRLARIAEGNPDQAVYIDTSQHTRLFHWLKVFAEYHLDSRYSKIRAFSSSMKFEALYLSGNFLQLLNISVCGGRFLQFLLVNLYAVDASLCFEQNVNWNRDLRSSHAGQCK